jgi:hypothetical protein
MIIFAAILLPFIAAITAQGKMIQRFEAQAKSLVPPPSQR